MSVDTQAYPPHNISTICFKYSKPQTFVKISSSGSLWGWTLYVKLHSQHIQWLNMALFRRTPPKHKPPSPSSPWYVYHCISLKKCIYIIYIYIWKKTLKNQPKHGVAQPFNRPTARFFVEFQETHLQKTGRLVKLDRYQHSACKLDLSITAGWSHVPKYIE